MLLCITTQCLQGHFSQARKYAYQTRSESEGKLKTPLAWKKSLTSFTDKAAKLWISIPGDLRQMTSKMSCSNNVKKKWIKAIHTHVGRLLFYLTSHVR